MNRRHALRAPTLGLCTVLLLAAGAATHAHPHAWIDLRTAVVLDAGGRVVALEQEWHFDPFYTALITGELGTSPAALRTNGAAMLSRLKSHAYFTEIRVGDEVRPPGPVHEFSTGLRADRYWLRFVLPLGAAIDPVARPVSFSVFDPTYFIEMRHVQGHVVGFVGGGSRRCEARIAPPSPSAEALVQASSPILDANPDASLGTLFAERVAVACR